MYRLTPYQIEVSGESGQTITTYKTERVRIVKKELDTDRGIVECVAIEVDQVMRDAGTM